MFGEDSAWMWGISLIAFAFGVVAGIIVSYLLLTQNSRARKLQDELHRVRAELDEYRSGVSQHFQKTSELFQGLTRQYRSVYEHLAAGAQTLCGGRLETPRLDLPEARLLASERRPPAEASGADDSGDRGETERSSVAPEDTVAREDDNDGDLGSAVHPGAAPHVGARSADRG